jgi:cytochrome b involved in lipid metabolism
MNRFEDFHPGGYFTLKKNYGRDITKFFNGE